MENPVNSIGIALSGGGYKASSFHLGVVSYLWHIGLEDKIKALSTVSGGTIFGAAYVKSLIDKKDFKLFFNEHYDFLLNVNMLGESLDYLSKGKFQVPSGRKNLITSASRVYSDLLFKNKKREFLIEDLSNSKTHLSEFIINTTDISYGLDFRFQISDLKPACGDRRVSIPYESSVEISISDVVAASTCFPGALEPIAIPDDFHFKNNVIPKVIKKVFEENGKYSPIGLMDGGIYDNQGIESIMLADERMDPANDLIIISDVTSEENQGFSFGEKQDISNLSLNKINIIIRSVVVLCLLSSSAMIYQIIKGFFDGMFRPFYTIINFGVPLLLSLSSAFLILWVRKKVISLMSQIPLIGGTIWDDLKRLTVNQIVDAFSLRISSIFTVATDVLTMRVRNLVYRVFYSSKRFEKKRVSNLLSTLKKGNKFPELPKEVKKPSKKIIDMATDAFMVEAASWTEEKKDLDDLICTGQFTTCYNLIKFIVRIYGDNPDLYEIEIKELWEKLVEDWSVFIKAPDFVFKGIKK